MPYILNKTNGAKLVTLGDASIDTTTSLTLVGRNYAGYGEAVNENFIKLLENFSNSTPPPRPIQGQLWFDSTTKQLSVCHDGKSFKGLANLRIQSVPPTSSIVGDLWWDKSTGQLKTYDGSEYKIIGPPESATAAWMLYKEPIDGQLVSVLRGDIEKNTVAVISNTDFMPGVDSLLYKNFSHGIKRGITMAGAVDSFGSTKSGGFYFWGTAAEALTANTATSVTVTSTSTNSTFYVPFASTSTGSSALSTDSGITYNPSTNVLSTIASSARYADLAERYAADAYYEVGTVLVIGGAKEVTVTDKRANTAVAGIVSEFPAYLMNKDAGNDETHPAIALKGRVPCKIVGSVLKGDLLVTSTRPGYAQAIMPGDSANAVIGKALEDNFEGSAIIEVLVV